MSEHGFGPAPRQKHDERRREMIKKLLFGLLVLTLGACASAPSKTGDADSQELFVPWTEIYAQGHTHISFPFDLTVADDFTVENETDAKSLVLFALKLER